MPLMNDNESRAPQTISIATAPNIPENEDYEAEESSIDPSLRALCVVCGKELLAYRCHGVYGWSHAEKADDPCQRFEEPWSRWSLGWIDRVNPNAYGNGRLCPIDRPGPSGTAEKSRILFRTMSPTKGEDVAAIESGGQCVWVWEAASKAIFLTSDGYLRVNGKGTIISAARMPVVLDFGGGFLAQSSSGDIKTVAKVAHVLDTKLISGQLFIKFRWLTHKQFVDELYDTRSVINANTSDVH